MVYSTNLLPSYNCKLLKTTKSGTELLCAEKPLPALVTNNCAHQSQLNRVSIRFFFCPVSLSDVVAASSHVTSRSRLTMLCYRRKAKMRDTVKQNIIKR